MDRINGFQIEFYYDTWIDPLLVIPIQTAEMVYRFDFPLINTYYDFVNDDSITQIKNVSSPYIVDTKLWNVSNVTTMESMFQDALVFNQPIDVWNTYNVENMAFIFKKCVSLSTRHQYMGCIYGHLDGVYVSKRVGIQPPYRCMEYFQCREKLVVVYV